MSNDNITTSQNLLKKLEEQMHSLYKLISEGEIVAANLKGTWTAISVTHKNFQGDVRESQGKE
jgi:hypothetical protein